VLMLEKTSRCATLYSVNLLNPLPTRSGLTGRAMAILELSADDYHAISL
jgi:hypothetical protein